MGRRPGQELDGRVRGIRRRVFVGSAVGGSRRSPLPIVKGRLGATDLLDDAGAVIAVSGNRQQHLASHGRGGAEARCSTTGWRVVIHDTTPADSGPSLLTSWLVATPLLAALALLFAWGAAQSVRRPLATLTGAAERIAEGDLAQPIPRLPADEVGRLGRAFERMRASLAESLARIAKDNVELEARVDARTRELARLNDELREREQTRLQLLRKVIRAQEDERKRIARELHDETGQTLTALAVRLDLAQVAAAGERAEQPVADARALARRSLEELHRLMHDLRPSVLDDLGLVAALRWLTEHRLAPKGISVQFRGRRRPGSPAARGGDGVVPGGSGGADQRRAPREGRARAGAGRPAEASPRDRDRG